MHVEEKVVRRQATVIEIEKKDKKWSVNFGSKVKADGDGLQCEAID